MASDELTADCNLIQSPKSDPNQKLRGLTHLRRLPPADFEWDLFTAPFEKLASQLGLKIERASQTEKPAASTQKRAAVAQQLHSWQLDSNDEWL